MTRVPMGSSLLAGQSPFGPKLHQRYPNLVPQGISAELIAEKWGLAREEFDAWRRWSLTGTPHRATDEGRFDHQIVPVPVSTADGSEMIARRGHPARLVARTPRRTQAVVPTRRRCDHCRELVADHRRHGHGAHHERGGGRAPRAHAARFHTFALAGSDPILMLTAPMPATEKVLARSHLTLDDMDLIEINEAFASVVLAWEHDLHPDMSTVNVNGGAIALGHPLGGSGG